MEYKSVGVERGLKAARVMARKVAKGLQAADRDDLLQEAQLAVLEKHAAGRDGTFGFWCTVAQRHLINRHVSSTRRASREENYAVRLYGHAAVEAGRRTTINEEQDT